MADGTGQHSFNMPPPQTGRLRPGEIVVDLFAGGGGECSNPEWAGKTRTAIHMPRWASRVDLEITGVRTERLNAISDADAGAEGVEFLRHVPDADETLTARQLFECLWSGINGAGSWDENPWVWVVEFKRVKP